MNVMEYYDEMGHCPNCEKLKALEILMKYISIQVLEDDLFDYYIHDRQYVSTLSSSTMTKQEYELLKKVGFKTK